MPLSDRINLLGAVLSQRGRPALVRLDEFAERVMRCLPERLQRRLALRRRRLVLEVFETSAQASLITGPDRESLGTLQLLGDEGLPSVPETGAREFIRSTELLLPLPGVLLRNVRFPVQVRRNLEQVIGYELDRLSPFQPQEVVYTFSVRAPQRDSERLSVDLAICKRELIDPWLTRLAALGTPVDRIVWPGAWPRANLLPPSERPARRWRPSINLVLLALVSILAIALLVTPLWQQREIAHQLEKAVKTARGEAIAVDDLRQALERARSGSMAVLQRKLDQPALLEILRTLTERLSDQTWIQNLEFHDNQVDIRGESTRATDLIALLEQSPGFENVAFRSPVTQIARTGRERFNISFNYVGHSTP